MQTIAEYLDVVYSGGLQENAEGVFCVLREPPTDSTPWPPCDEGTLLRAARRNPKDRAFYLSIMSAFPDEEGRRRNRRAQFASLHIIPLDDVGSKVQGNALPPTAILETSPGNYQWHYVLREPIDDVELAERVIRTVFESQGLTDTGGKLVNKYVRLPGGINGKLRDGVRDTFEVRLVECVPERTYTWQELLEAWGLTLEVKRPTGTKAAVSQKGRVVDPVLTWLEGHGRVLGAETGGWVTIECPWADEHTQGREAAYSPLGAGEMPEWRGFKCHHDHCSGRKGGDLLAWVQENGGPVEALYDPLGVAVQRYALVEQGRLVWDRVGEGGFAQLDDWKAARAMRLPPREGQVGAPATLANAWQADLRTPRYLGRVFEPGAPEVIDGKWVNLWKAPDWPEVKGEPTWFLEHIDWILPDPVEASLFKDWLAFKMQYPGKRSYGVVMVADEVFGIGRSLVGQAIERLLPRGQVSTLSLEDFLGTGGNQSSYNEWALGTLFIILNEVKETLGTVRDDQLHFERLKDRIDPLSVEVRIKEKYGRSLKTKVYYNTLAFTNHVDALRIPEGDRRVCVLRNASVRRRDEDYAAFAAALENPLRLAELYWWLMRRDVSGFQYQMAPSTEAKEMMTELGLSEAEDAWQRAMRWLPGDLVTERQLLTAIKSALVEMDALSFEGAAKVYARRRFRRLAKASQPVVRIGDATVRLRVLRHASKWLPLLEQGGGDLVREEVQKNGGATTVPINVVRKG